jgi:hypothetical protein
MKRIEPSDEITALSLLVIVRENFDGCPRAGLTVGNL